MKFWYGCLILLIFKNLLSTQAFDPWPKASIKVNRQSSPTHRVGAYEQLKTGLLQKAKLLDIALIKFFKYIVLTKELRIEDMLSLQKEFRDNAINVTSSDILSELRLENHYKDTAQLSNKDLYDSEFSYTSNNDNIENTYYMLDDYPTKNLPLPFEEPPFERLLQEDKNKSEEKPEVNCGPGVPVNINYTSYTCDNMRVNKERYDCK